MTDAKLKTLMKRPSKKSKLHNHFNISRPMEMLQMDLLFLPEDKGFNYALTVVDCASRYKAARAIRTKTSAEVIENFIDIYENDKNIRKPEKLNLDKGGEFKSEDMRIFCKNNGIKLIFNEPSNHLAFVENFNKELAKKLFPYQHKKELESGIENSEWVSNLKAAVKFLNNRYTKMIGMKPIDAVKLDYVPQPQDKFDVKDVMKFYPIGTKVYRMLNWDEHQKLFSGKISVERRRATDPFWHKDPYIVTDIVERGKKSLIEHILKDENGKKYPHSFTYFQLTTEN
jgi:hypothetical protein